MYGPAPNALEDVSLRDSFRIRSFIVMIDYLLTNFEQRAKVYKNITSKFSANLNASNDDVKNLIKDYLNNVYVNIVSKI